MLPIVCACSRTVKGSSVDLLKRLISAGKAALQSCSRLSSTSAVVKPIQPSASSFGVISAMIAHTSKLACKVKFWDVAVDTSRTSAATLSVRIADVEYGRPRIEQHTTSRTRRLLNVRSLLRSAESTRRIEANQDSPQDLVLRAEVAILFSNM